MAEDTPVAVAPLALLAVFVVAALAAAASTPAVSRLARLFDVVDRPNERKVNRRQDIPLLGGLAVALGLVMGLAAASWTLSEDAVGTDRIRGLLIGSAMLLAVGAWDDRWGLGAWSKLGVQIAAAAVAIASGFVIPHLREPISRAAFEMPQWMAFAVTGLWIVGVTNALNLMDGLDGLSAGIGAIIAATLVAICWQAGQVTGVVFGTALVGALAGFLPFNFPPARIFLGDTGALLIGYCLALLALEGSRQPALLTFIVPLLALAVPLLDTLLSIVRRVRQGRNPFRADRAHMHHRLLEFEGSDRDAVLSLYFLTACFCVISVSFTRLQGVAAIIFLAAVVVLTLRLLRNLGVLEGDLPDAGGSSGPGPEVNER